MSEPAQQKLQAMAHLKQKNLAFFQRNFDNIYQLLVNHQFVNSRLNIDPDTLEVNLIQNNRAFYPEDVTNACQKEVDEFNAYFGKGKFLRPLRPSYTDEHPYGRFYHSCIRQFLDEADSRSENHGQYVFQDTLPQVIFYGSGLGIHITQLLSERKIKHVLVFESNLDIFAASLMITDWEALAAPYVGSKESSFGFLVGDLSQEADKKMVAYSSIWNAVVNTVPFFPTNTVFFNHRGDKDGLEVIQRFNKEIQSFIEVWGFYDDEVNQFNHTRLNVNNQVPVLPDVKFKDCDKPVLICGSGPSLDKYIDLIKAQRDKIILISAGSSIHALLKNDIKADLHIELESDYIAYQATAISDTDAIKDIPIIGATQIHPWTYDLFDNKLMFFKKETPYAQLMSEPHNSIGTATPSCSNTAFAIAAELGFNNIFLLGMDFGYVKGQAHHSKDTYYFEEEGQEMFKDYNDQLDDKAYFSEENQHGTIYTIGFLDVCRSHLQRKIREMIHPERDLKITNLSQGATIDGTQFGDHSDLETAIKRFEDVAKPDFIQELFAAGKPLDLNFFNRQSEEIFALLKDTRKLLLPLVQKMKPTRDSIDETVFQISTMLNRELTREHGNAVFFIRGSLWFFIFNMYALSYMNSYDDKLELLTASWKKWFGLFLNDLEKHARFFTTDEKGLESRLTTTIMNPEPNIEGWVKTDNTTDTTKEASCQN